MNLWDDVYLAWYVLCKGHHAPNLVQLLSLNTNLLVTLSPKQTMLSSLPVEFSLILPPPGTPLISHFPKRDGPTNDIPISVPESPLLTPNMPPVWFSGIPFACGNNPLIVPILSASEEALLQTHRVRPDV
ncbi:hypothetical protein EDD85DRAFT_980303 [Armillaria nabsnona]|nr:hypothetical protein EDD85DRAFT_980303 [Armillaria nabsnona]